MTLAERAGFEPAGAYNPVGFGDRCNRPLRQRHPRIFYLAAQTGGNAKFYKTRYPRGKAWM